MPELLTSRAGGSSINKVCRVRPSSFGALLDREAAMSSARDTLKRNFHGTHDQCFFAVWWATRLNNLVDGMFSVDKISEGYFCKKASLRDLILSEFNLGANDSLQEVSVVASAGEALLDPVGKSGGEPEFQA